MDLADVFKKPGREWSHDERAACVFWLFGAKLDRLLLFALHHLGSNRDVHDAWDAWMSFCLESLHRVFESYDPDKGRNFPSYLYFCLQRHCERIGKRQRHREEHERQFQKHEQSGCDFEIRVTNGVPESDLHNRVECRDLMQKALNRLPRDLAVSLVEFYLLGRSISTIAANLRVPEGTVKMRLHRARLRMQREIHQLEAPPPKNMGPGEVARK